MRLATFVLVGALCVGAGCFGKATAPVTAKTECETDPTILLVGNDLWEVCAPEDRQQAVGRLQNASLDLQAFASATLDELVGANQTETHRIWQEYEQARKAPASPPQLFRQALAAAKDNVTVINGTWADIQASGKAEELKPVDSARATSEAFLAQAAANVTHARQFLAASLGGSVVAGAVVGSLVVIRPMAQARKKAAYWGAFSENRDVQKRQRALGAVGLGSMVLGILAAAALVFLRFA